MQEGKLSIVQIADDEDGRRMHVIIFVCLKGKRVEIHVGMEEWGEILSGSMSAPCGFEIKPDVTIE